jgi:hypothetical protein
VALLTSSASVRAEVSACNFVSDMLLASPC